MNIWQCSKKNLDTLLPDSNLLSRELPTTIFIMRTRHGGTRTKNWPKKFPFVVEHFKSLFLPHNRVARWFIFKPKIPNWVIFGGP
jgi:hypothetical protein